MHNEKSYFRTQNSSLAICHIGVVTIEQYEPVQQLVQHGRSTINLHRGTAAHTVDTLRALKFEVLKNPTYSLDLTPSDFHFNFERTFAGPEVCR